MYEIKIYKIFIMLSIDFNLLLLFLYVMLNIGLYRYICYENYVIISNFLENLKMVLFIIIFWCLLLFLVKDSVFLLGLLM